MGLGVYVAGVVQSHESLLLQRFADVFDRVAAPDLPFLDDPAGRNHAVGGDDASLLENGTLHDDRVVSDVDLPFDSAGVECAIVLYDRVTVHKQFCA